MERLQLWDLVGRLPEAYQSLPGQAGNMAGSSALLGVAPIQDPQSWSSSSQASLSLPFVGGVVGFPLEKVEPSLALRGAEWKLPFLPRPTPAG